MRSFSSGSFGRSDDPWFRVGNIDVSTTIGLVGFGIISVFIYVAEGNTRALSKFFWMTTRDFGFLTGGSVLEGQIWRLVTWPLFLEPGARVFWSLILFAVFYMLGSQLEASMGRRPFALFLGTITVVTPIVMTVVEVLTGINGVVAGLRYLEFAVLIGFALVWPEARFMFGIPAWVIAAVIVGVETLQTVADRNWYGLMFGACVVALALLLMRSMGFAEQAEWIPRAPLPAFYRTQPSYGQAYGYTPTSTKPSKPKRGRHRRNLRSVSPANKHGADPSDTEIDALLDQVANQGLDSLSKAQRKQLEAYSKRLRDRDK